MKQPKRHPSSGFTLLEIIIVVGLIAALAGTLIAALARNDEAAKIKIEQQFLESGLRAQLMSYRLHLNTYPTTAQGLQALSEKPQDVGRSWRGPYVDRKLVDSWGSAYQYRYPGEHNRSDPDIWSTGPNGIDEGGLGDDINNWGE